MPVGRPDQQVVLALLPNVRRLSDAASGKVNPAVEQFHADSVKRWSRVYEALAN